MLTIAGDGRASHRQTLIQHTRIYINTHTRPTHFSPVAHPPLVALHVRARAMVPQIRDDHPTGAGEPVVEGRRPGAEVATGPEQAVQDEDGDACCGVDVCGGFG